MDAKQFLSEFRHIATAPGGVDRLREMILSLAFQGTLSEHAPEDVTGLLSALDKQRANPPRESGKSRKRTIAAARSVQPPFAIPGHWQWISLSEIGHGWGQKTPRTDFTYIDVSSIDNRRGTIREPLTVLTASQAPSRARKIVRRGTVIYSTVRPYLLNIALIDQDFEQEPIASTAFAVVHPWKGILPKYVYYYLRCPFFIAYVQSVQIGMAYPAISDEKFFTGPIPLPPTSEQHLIVAKIDALMTLCDKLEEQHHARERVCEITRTSVFQALGRAKTSTELHPAWHRVYTNSELLLDKPESIQSYRGAILDLAMSGSLLAPQDRAASTGAMLLQHIAQSRAAWADTTEGQEHKEATAMLRKVRTQRIPTPNLDLPQHWTWGSFLQISQAVVDCHNKTAPYVSDGIHLVRTTDIRIGRMDLKHTRKISPDTYEYWARRLPPKTGDVFFTREAPMGEAAIVPEGEKVCLGQRTILIRLFPNLFNNRFLLYAIYSPSFQERMVKAAIGMTVKHLRVGGVEDLMVPVPPKEEQDRIVAVVDALFAHCDQLETLLSSRHTTASNLAKASVEAITGIRIEGQEKMKAPKTEVVSTLRIGISPTNKEQAPLASILVRNQGELPAKTLWGSSGLEIEDFYQQLRNEMAKGWIVQPEAAYVREVEAG